MVAAIVAALKAIPEITGLIRDIRDGITTLSNERDDRQFEKFVAELAKDTRRLQNAKTEDEVRAIIRSINPVKQL